MSATPNRPSSSVAEVSGWAAAVVSCFDGRRSRPSQVCPWTRTAPAARPCTGWAPADLLMEAATADESCFDISTGRPSTCPNLLLTHLNHHLIP